MLHGTLIINDADYSPFTLYGVGTFMAHSGNGVYRNHGGCRAIPDNGPIPPGKYWIVGRGEGGLFSKANAFIRDTINKTFYGAEFKHSEWFALYRDDWGIDDGTWINDVYRGLFRLHPGTISKGCITIAHNSDYALIRNALLREKPEPVPCMRSLMTRGYVEVVADGATCP
ncbi:DUF2778 domain-containing protein [Klebsiella sp. R390]|uniref:DUF2778 domain-containing protein n=1 Tax=Klebsiella sp. R390 TaxID=2755400 RepID=UPI003DA8B5AC